MHTDTKNNNEMSSVFISSTQIKYSPSREVRFNHLNVSRIFLFFLCVLCFTSDSVSRLWKPSSGARTDGRSTSCSTPANSPTTPWCMWVLQAAENLHPASKMPPPSSPLLPPRVISYSDRQWRGRPQRRGRVRSSSPHGEPSRAEPGWRRGGRLDGGEAEGGREGEVKEWGIPVDLPVIQKRWRRSSGSLFSQQNQPGLKEISPFKDISGDVPPFWKKKKEKFGLLK